MINLESKIEAILFFKGDAVSIKKLSDILKVSSEDVQAAIQNLKQTFSNRGIVLIEKNNEVMLGTAPELSSIIENLQKEELNKDLSKAALEALSIILYKSEVTRAEIDYIRGVNSSFTLRALSVRGLIEKTTDKKDNRRYIYKPTFELINYMGIKSISELPDFETITKELQATAQNLDNSSEENGAQNETKNEISTEQS